MFGSDALRHVQQPGVCVQAVDRSERREHLPQLEGDEAVADLSEIRIGVDQAVVRQARQAVRLEDDRDAAQESNEVDVAAVGVAVEGVARPVADEGAGYERASAQHGALFLPHATTLPVSSRRY